MQKDFKCDSRCHNAQGKRCTCICNGRYHGLGSEKASKLIIKDFQKGKPVPETELFLPLFEIRSPE